jgi:hypothetical protein
VSPETDELSTVELAAALKRSRRTVQWWADRGRIACRETPGGQHRVTIATARELGATDEAIANVLAAREERRATVSAERRRRASARHAA